jgi:hypothetical protein
MGRVGDTSIRSGVRINEMDWVIGYCDKKNIMEIGTLQQGL